MSVSSVSSNVQNTNAVQPQKQPARVDVENDNDKDDVVSKAVSQKVDVQKAVAQKVVVEKSDAQKVDAQKVDEKKAVVQTASRPAVNASGQIIGSIIDTQA